VSAIQILIAAVAVIEATHPNEWNGRPCFVFVPKCSDPHRLELLQGRANHAEDAEEFISQKSDNLVLAMVKFIYDESGEIGPRPGRKQQWSGWEI